METSNGTKKIPENLVRSKPQPKYQEHGCSAGAKLRGKRFLHWREAGQRGHLHLYVEGHGAACGSARGPAHGESLSLDRIPERACKQCRRIAEQRIRESALVIYRALVECSILDRDTRSLRIARGEIVE